MLVVYRGVTYNATHLVDLWRTEVGAVVVVEAAVGRLGKSSKMGNVVWCARKPSASVSEHVTWPSFVCLALQESWTQSGQVRA